MKQEDILMLKGKKGIVTGVANNMSIAYAIAKLLVQQGAEIGLTYQGEVLKKRIDPIAEELNCSFIHECDVKQETSINSLFEAAKNKWGKIDFFVHAIAFADKEELKGRYVDTSLSNFLNTMEISCYSLTSMARKAQEIMPEGGSIITLTYLGAEKVIPCYNVMGVAKAALEASVRYLSADLGVQRIRVNAISAGPIKTLAASGISDFRSMLSMHEQIAPLKRNTTQEEVAKSALYLISDLSSSVTGEIHYVDCGYNIMGAYPAAK